MELLKANPIIDYKYKPSMDLNYIDYFVRAMAFAQTNYQDQLQKISKANFHKISPTHFFEEYAWCVCLHNNTAEKASKYFPELSRDLVSFYNSFWDLNNFPKEDVVKDKIMLLIEDEKKFDAIYRCARIFNRGIKLFGWDKYKDNFLGTPEKLCALPMIGLMGARRLSHNVGLSSDVISTAQLHRLAAHWGFQDSKELCAAIQKNVSLRINVIEMIMWYAAHTFDTNIPSR